MLSDITDYVSLVVEAIDSTSDIVNTNINSISNSHSDFDEVFSMQSSMVDHVQDINSLMSILNTQGNTIKSNMNELKSINKSTNLSINTMTSNLEELQGEFTEIHFGTDVFQISAGKHRHRPQRTLRHSRQGGVQERSEGLDPRHLIVGRDHFCGADGDRRGKQRASHAAIARGARD